MIAGSYCDSDVGYYAVDQCGSGGGGGSWIVGSFVAVVAVVVAASAIWAIARGTVRVVANNHPLALVRRARFVDRDGSVAALEQEMISLKGERLRLHDLIEAIELSRYGGTLPEEHRGLRSAAVADESATLLRRIEAMERQVMRIKRQRPTLSPETVTKT